MELQSRTQGRSDLVRRRFPTNEPTEQTGLIEDFMEQESDLSREIRAEAQQIADEQVFENAGFEEMKGGDFISDNFDITERQYFGEQPIELTPIPDEPSITPLIDDIISTQSDMVDVPLVEDAFLDVVVEGAGEEAVIGSEIAVGGTAALVTETAIAVVPELAAALVVGGALYGLELGVENVLDIGASQDKKYHEQRNEELGTHELDKREIDYQIKQLGAAKKYYKDQVDHMNFGPSDASKTQHAKDKAMLTSIQHSIDAIHNQQRKGEPVYAVVKDGVANAYVNKASDDELDVITQDYIKNGGDIFEGVDPTMIEALGIADAIGSDDVNEKRIQIEQTQQNQTQQAGDIAKSQGLDVGTPGTQ